MACVFVLVDMGKGHDAMSLGVSIAMETATLLAAIAFGRAWWTLWHENLPARKACITASVVSLIFPVVLLVLYALRPADFWPTGAMLLVPLAIGILGVVFGSTKTANSLPPAARGHLGHAIVGIVFLLIFAGGLARGIARGVLAFSSHKHLQLSYFVGIAVCGFVTWLAIQGLRHWLRERRAAILGARAT